MFFVDVLYSKEDCCAKMFSIGTIWLWICGWKR